jgi:hypothetical protein
MRILLSLALFVAQPVLAASVTVSYSGQVGSLTYADCQNFVNGNCTSWNFSSIQTTNFLAGSTIGVGQSFNGSFSYDSNAVMAPVSGDGFQGVYLNAVASSGFRSSTLTLPSISLSSTGGGNVSVVNGRDGYDALLVQDYYSNSNFFVSMKTFQLDSTGTVFSSFSLPTNLGMSSFNHNSFGLGMLRRADGDQVQLVGTLTSIVIAPAVPEPTTALLVGAGLLLLAVRAARKASMSS